MAEIKLSIGLEGDAETVLPIFEAVMQQALGRALRRDPPKLRDDGVDPMPGAPGPAGDRWLDFGIFPNIEPDELVSLKAWLDAALHRQKPYSLLVIYGPAGSGKSVLSRILKDFIEGTLLRVTVYDAAVELTDQQRGQISTTLAESPVIVNSIDAGWVGIITAAGAAYTASSPAPTVITLTRALDPSEWKPGIETLGFRT